MTCSSTAQSTKKYVHLLNQRAQRLMGIAWVGGLWPGGGPGIFDRDWNSILNPFFKATMSGYTFFCISKALGMTLTAHCPFWPFRPAWKQSQKYPGCLGMLQNAYMERVGLACTYVASH